MKVCMLVRNPYVIDSRVRKEAHAVAEAGHDVTIVAIKDKANQLPDEQWEGPVRVLRVRVKNLLGEWRSRRREADRRADLWIRKALGQPRRLAGNAWRRLGGSSPLSRAAAALLVLGCLLVLLAFWWVLLGLLAARCVIFLEKALLDSRLLVALRKTEACRILSHFLCLRPTVYGLRADVYHAHNLDTLRLAVAAARHNWAAVIYDSHELEYYRTAPTWTMFDRWFMRRSERTLIRKADVVVAASEGYADWLRQKYCRNVGVIYNSPSLKTGLDVRDVGDWRKKFNVGDRKLILYAGTILPGRGLMVMLDVMEILGGGYLFVLFGQAGRMSETETYDQIVARRGLSDRIRLAGVIPEDHLVPTLAQADCTIVLIQGISLSYRLTMPNKLFQGAFAGVPIIGSTMPGIGKIMKLFCLGPMVDPDDPHAVVAAIRHVCNEPHDYAKDPRLAEKLLAEYGWETNKKRLVDIYAWMDRSRGQ